MPAARIFISHSAHERETGRVLDALSKELKRRGFEPFVDRERLKAGEVWRDRLYTEILRSHGGIILFSESALESEWVYFESAALSLRRWTTPDFPLVPVVLPTLRPTFLKQPPWEPMDLSRLQVFKDASESDASRIADRFEPLRQSFSETPLDALEEALLEVLSRHQARLERAATRLGLTVTNVAETRREVARAFFHSSVELFYESMKHLAATMTRDGVGITVDIIYPFWVRPEAVVLLAHAAMNPRPHAVSLLNAEDKLIAEMYVRRAAGQYPLPWGVIPVTAAGGERTSGVVIAEIRDFYRRRYHGAELDDATVDARLASLAQVTLLVVIFPPATRAQTIADVRATYPDLTYLVRTGTTVPPKDRFLGLDARVLTPPLAPGTEDEATKFYDALITMRDNMR